MATTKITSPELFDLGSLDTALKLPSGTTAERPTSPSTGEWRYNTTTNLVEFWDGGEWRDLQSEDIPPIPSENFNVVLYTGNGSTQSITGVGFKPDFVWLKLRSAAGYNHVVFDSTRGATKRIYPNDTAAENSNGKLISFDSDGFTFNGSGSSNVNGQTFVAWCWKANGGTTSSNTDGTITSTVQANTKAGFSIVKYTGNNVAGATIGHGLASAPDMIIVKNLSTTDIWTVQHSALGYTNYIDLNNLNAATVNSAVWYAAPTSNVFSFGANPRGNGNGNNIIAYCFKNVDGFSKFGSYTGNSSDNGPIVETGFEPAFLIIKNTSDVGSWFMYDNKRNTSNPRINYLLANGTNVEASDMGGVDFLSNGFQIKDDHPDVNDTGDTYLYIAFASDPSTAPVLADSFTNKLYTGTGVNGLAVTGLGFKPSMVWIKNRGLVRDHNLADIIQGVSREITPNTSEAQENRSVTSFDSDGFTLDNASGNYNANGNNYVAWNWKANPTPTINTDGTIQSVVSANQASGISIIQYTGTGANATIGHGLSAAPELVIVKKTSGVQNWMVGATVVGWTKYLELNLTNPAATASTTWNDTDPTTTTVSLGSSNNGNQSGQTYIMYAFHSVAGFSDIGFWQGGTTTITTGFQPSFVIQQDYGLGGGWGIFDSARSGQVLNANTNAAESSSSFVTFTATGFTVPSESSSVFRLYMAFKENPSPVVPAGQMAYLVVAGGAGGGGTVFPNKGGGGGAGGLRTSFGSTSGGGASAESNLTLSSGTYTITVGAGGGAAANGVASTISGTGTVSTVGGGQGGAITVSGTAGGSGGGTGGNNGGSITGGAGTAGEGFAGGTTAGNAGYDGSGGGGAAQAGGNGGFRNTTGGVGGNGLAVSITGASVAYAGGGGGGSDSTSVGARPGGTGGGGAGGSYLVAGVNGTANLGGGAGAGGEDAQPGTGGSGVVILRMRTSDYSGSTTGSPTVTTTGEETVLTYTGSGTYVHS